MIEYVSVDQLVDSLRSSSSSSEFDHTLLAIAKDANAPVWALQVVYRFSLNLAVSVETRAEIWKHLLQNEGLPLLLLEDPSLQRIIKEIQESDPTVPPQRRQK